MMYRCVACDTPAQVGHAPVCPTFQQAMNKPADPWGFREDDNKLDIQAGVRVQRVQELEEWL